MKTLHLSSHLDVPLEVVTEKLAWIGVTGSGKSYGASKLAELLWNAHAQFVVLDPVGVWYGLRLAQDGKGAGMPIPVFGGLHGDVPLEATAGALVADMIVDRDLSAVVDVSQFESDADKARFVSAFADRLYQRRKRAPAAMHVFLEEAQEFVPQNPQPGEQMMLHRLHRMQKLGRNFGIGTSIITQRPQETSKKALNQAQTVFAFRLTGSQERKAVELWIQDKGLDQDLVAALPKIETGSCHVWSPAWLQVSKMIRIAAKATYDASATPKVGARAEQRTLAPIDIEKLRADMKATIEKAKDEDPRHLRDRIRKLEAELALKPKAAAPAAPAKERVVEKFIFRGGELDRLDKLLERGAKHIDKTIIAQKEAAELVKKIGMAVELARSPMVPVAPAPRPAPHLRIHGIDHRVHVRSAAPAPRQQAAEGVMGPSHQRVLNALAWLAQLGAAPATRAQAAVFAGMTPNGGYYARIVGELKTAGLIGYPTSGTLALTETGHKQADPGAAPQTNEALQNDVLRRLGPSHRRVLEALIGAFPQPLPRTNVAAAAQMDAAGGYFARLVGELKTMGVIDYPQKGMVRAAEILFIKETAIHG